LDDTITKRLEAAREVVDAAQEALAEARAARDQVIVAAVQAGLPHRTVGRLAGVTYGRVGQVMSGHRGGLSS
jgi:hypothetical protein